MAKNVLIQRNKQKNPRGNLKNINQLSIINGQFKEIV